MTPSHHRVLIVSSELPPGPGGIGAHAHAVARQLRKHGWTVELLGSQDYCSETQKQAFNKASDIPITTFGRGANPASTAWRRIRQLRLTIARFCPDVVLASGRRSLWLAANVTKSSSVPVVAIAHGSELGGSSLNRRLTRWALGKAKQIVAVSEFTGGLVHALHPNAPVTVVHNGAEGDRFEPGAARGAAFRARHGVGAGPMILTVGSVSERKGQHLVVSAMADLLRDHPDLTYVVVGRPHETERLKDLAAAPGVSERIRLLGQLDDDEVLAAYQAADVFAMTSTRTATGDVEGYGIAVTEAALCGVPAVVSGDSGVREAVEDGITGVIAEPTPSGVAEGLRQLLADDDRRRRMGDAARQRAETSGTWASKGRIYADLLGSVAAGRRPRIVVISHTEHYRRDDGSVVGFGPTLRELDHLATLASELVHIAPLHDSPAPAVALPNQADNIRHVLVRPAGGPRSIDRLSALRVVPHWIRTIHRELRRADVVHVRAPAGVSIVALAVLTVRHRPKDRWVKYAGNWMPDHRDAFTYRLQRAWLRSGLVRASVTVNGSWPDQPGWIRAFDNPTLTEEELARGADAAEARPMGPPWRGIFVGRVEEAKGADRAVEIAEALRQRGIDISLDLVGDGPLRSWVEERIEAGDGETIGFHGWLPRSELESHLAASHLMLLPTAASEGFPKVIGEALAFGIVPVTTGVSSIEQVLGQTGGALVLARDADWPEEIEKMLRPREMNAMTAEGLAHAQRWSYTTYLDQVRTMAREDWGRRL